MRIFYGSTGLEGVFRGRYYVRKAKMCVFDGAGVGRKCFCTPARRFIYEGVPKKSSGRMFFQMSRSRLESGGVFFNNYFLCV